MKTTTLDKLIWTLIYGGLLVLSLSVFVGRGDGTLGALLGVAGGAATLAGIVLVAVRARTKDAPAAAPVPAPRNVPPHDKA